MSDSWKRKRRKLLNEPFSSHLFEYCHQGLLFHLFDSIDLASYPTVVVEGKYIEMCVLVAAFISTIGITEILCLLF